MQYIIMANGKGIRWGNHNGVPKYLAPIDGEPLIQRTVRLVHEADPGAHVVISSANPECEVEGAVRHAPKRGQFEIDRFCYELIASDTCFLYGDTYYTKEAINLIVGTPVEKMLFFGTTSSIVAVKVSDGELMLQCIDDLLALIESGIIADAKGWQLYHRFRKMPLEGREIDGDYVLLNDSTTDFNHPSDYDSFITSLQ